MPTSKEKTLPPTGQEQLPNLMACLATIRRPELYRNFIIHLFVMFPGVVVMCLIARWLDQSLGLSRLLPWPVSLWPGLLAIGIGGASVWYVYGYLFLVGGGSPGTHVDGGPVRIVDTGPYTIIRHPSVPGKFLAATGVGLAFGSPSFLFGFLPMLLVYSLLTNRFLQEPTCDKRFGATYQQYRAAVPMVLPRPSGIMRWIHGGAALQGAIPDTPNIHPTAVRHELFWYLVGLCVMVGLFTVFAVFLR
ncbi:MAG: hypothetical protein K8R59_10980 [Thermoanaerobaculales bacterium]|nr:hypothetical protein [Thermoanaerobaculales bacterium]